MQGPIWVIVEQKDGIIKKVSFEVLSLAKKLALKLNKKVCAVLTGNKAAHSSSDLFSFGADMIYLLEDDLLAVYSAEGYTQALYSLYQKEEKPYLILTGASIISKDYTPRFAARIGTDIAVDCTSVNVLDDDLEFVRPVYAGKAILSVSYETKDVRFATIRSNAVEAVKCAGENSSGEVKKVDCGITESTIRVKVEKLVQSVSTQMDLTEARIIVSGGRGMKGPENFTLLEEMAEAVGGVVGASRAAVDAGWREHQYQVGQTGKTVSPDLYIACGISGAIQHLAGMSSSKCIVAINSDPDANIYKVSDYGLVGDLFQIIPLLTSEFKKIGTR